MKTHMMLQYSPEWWEIRRGVPTASQFDKILTPTGKLSSQATAYIDELIADRFVLNPNFMTERPMTRAMANGTDMEPEARRWYAMEHPERRVVQVGFCVTDDGRFGCSPDALVGDDGVLELKCPLGKTHVGYLREGLLPADYRPQCHGHLIVTGRPWVDFVSYAPGLPPFSIRVTADSYTEKLRSALDVFWEQYQATLTALLKPKGEE
jgi:hypothetical protein